MHILRRRYRRYDHWNYSWKYCFSSRCCQSTSGISKLVGAVFVPISKQCNMRGPLTQLSARGISLAAVRSPFYCRLRSRPFFLVLFPSCFLRLPSSASLFLPLSFPPALFVRTLIARLDSAVTAILSFYTFHRSVSIYSPFLFGTDCVVLKIPRAIVTAASCNGPDFKLIWPIHMSQKWRRWLSVNRPCWHDTLRKKLLLDA